MAKEYNVGSRLYLPVWVTDMETNVMMGPDKSTVITDAKFAYTYFLGQTKTGKVRYGEEGLLLTAEEVAEDVNTESDDALEELKARNAELEALLKEVTATRDEAVRQINELLAENSKLKADCNDWKKTANERLSAMQMLSTDRNKLIGSNAELKEWYDEANKTASEAAEANDELKAKIAELRAENEKWKAKYDNLSAINHEQGLRIGDLDKKVAELEGENTNLNYLLEAQPEKEATRPVNVVLNDGTEIRFKKCTSYDYRTDIDMLVVKDGDNYIAGFMRGDKPGNLAYWMGE